MGNGRRGGVTKTVVAGAVITLAASIGTTAAPEMMANGDLAITTQQIRELRAQIALMAESNTQIIGLPDWLTSTIGIGGGIVAPSGTSAQDVYNMLAKQDKNPLIGWGTGGVPLKPEWNTWYNLPDLTNPESLLDPTKDQYYTPEGTVQVDTTSGWVRDEDYFTAYGHEYAGVVAAGKATLVNQKKLTVRVPYSVNNPVWGNSLAAGFCNESICGPRQFTGYQDVEIDNPYYVNGENYDDAEVDKFLSGQSYQGDVTIKVPVSTDEIIVTPRRWVPPVVKWGITITPGFWIPAVTIPAYSTEIAIPYNYEFQTTDLVDNDWAAQTDEVMEEKYPDLKPEKLVHDIPVYNDEGYWTTMVSGQWGSPTDYFARLEPLLSGGDINLDGLSTQDLFYLAKLLGVTDVSDLGNIDVSNLDWKKLSILAPILNWTTYIQNVNLIGYGDGNIAIGEGYRQFIEGIQDGTVTAGPARTEGRYLEILSDDDGNPIVRFEDIKTGDIWDYPLPNEVDLSGPIPTDLADLNIKTTPGGVIDFTLVGLALLRNPGRPNGGLYSRFAPIYEELTGVNPVTPERTDILPEGIDPQLVTKLLTGSTDDIDFDIDSLGQLITLINNANGQKMVVTVKADATWAYDLLSDAPATANPVAWANSAVSSLFLVNMANELLGASKGQNSAGVGLTFYAVPEGERDAGSYYATLTTNGIPLLAPLRLPANLISTVTGQQMETPLADTLEPLARILVNIGYTDVVTPEKLESGYYDTEFYDDKTFAAYDRTYMEMHNPVLFGTQTLSQSEIARLQGDLIAAVGEGFGTGFTSAMQGTVIRLLRTLGVDEEDVLKVSAALSEPGKAITKVSAQIGDAVGDALVAVNNELPQLINTDDPNEQETLGGIHKVVGQAVEPVKDGSDAINQGAKDLDLAVTGGQGKEIADAVTSDPIGSLKKAGNDLQSGVDKRITKTEKSIAGAQDRAKAVRDLVRSGDIGGAAKEIGKNAENRAKRLQKDAGNGLNKVKKAFQKKDRSTQDKDSSSQGKDSSTGEN